MKQSIRMFLCLFCAVVAAAAAQAFNWIGRFGLQEPDRPRGRVPAGRLQEKQSIYEPLTWRFPDPPAEEEPRFLPEFDRRTPTAASSVTVVCGENAVRVEAKKDLLGIGKPVRVDDVTLGGCPATGEDAEVLVFESKLPGCGSQLHMTEDSFIYTFVLRHTPRPLGGAKIIRTREVAVEVQCHYPRQQEVSSGLMNPNWTPFSVDKASEEDLLFSFRLMTDDWQSTRLSAHFLLGDMMKFEASVKQFHHVPLRVTLDSCVATVSPIIDTVPRYAFLGNKGCLFDSQLTGSSSQFLPRSHDDRLQFELEAFRFQEDNSGVIYIACNVRATLATAAVDAIYKACSFSNKWSEVSGNHAACACCDTDCGTGSQSHLTGTAAQWEQEATVGPITVEERPQL